MLKNKRLLLVTLFLILAACAVLGLRIGYPSHRVIALILLALGWVPLVISYRINHRLLHAQKIIIKRKTRPFFPHAVVALILTVSIYIAWVLVPVSKSPLVELTPIELRGEITDDLESYLMLRRAADDLVSELAVTHLLERKVDSLTAAERKKIRALWRDGVMVFLEFDMLKEKYRGFHQIDYVAEPQLHADAFMLAYMAYVAQYEACLHVAGMVDKSDFMKTLLNEAGDGIPEDSYFTMKQRLTHPNVILRMNAGAAYRELINKDVTFEEAVIDDFRQRQERFYRALGKSADIFIENPLDLLERAAFEAVFPIQKDVALKMSHIRTAQREYLITPAILASCREMLKPGDILIQRRNWHMTNIGIPGFWPHVALYIGAPDEVEAYFRGAGIEALKTLEMHYPEVVEAWRGSDHDGYPMRVMEAIRPGVVLQSLETSARCDYLGVVRPNLSKGAKFNALVAAFSHYGKPYDLNFDFATDHALVCSELVYKGYRAAARLPLEPEIINGRLLLPPNRLAELAVEHMGTGDAFSFVLFLDAIEKKDVVVKRDEAAFRESWQRPKWDVMQQ